MPGKNWCEREALTWFSRFRIQNSSPSVTLLVSLQQGISQSCWTLRYISRPVLGLHCCKSHVAHHAYHHPGTAPQTRYLKVMVWHPACFIWKALFRCTYHANCVLCFRPQGTSRIMPMTINSRCLKCEPCSSELHRYLYKLSKPSAKCMEFSRLRTTKTALGLTSFSAAITSWVGTREICS